MHIAKVTSVRLQQCWLMRQLFSISAELMFKFFYRLSGSWACHSMNETTFECSFLSTVIVSRGKLKVKLRSNSIRFELLFALLQLIGGPFMIPIINVFAALSTLTRVPISVEVIIKALHSAHSDASLFGISWCSRSTPRGESRTANESGISQSYCPPFFSSASRFLSSFLLLIAWALALNCLRSRRRGFRVS